MSKLLTVLILISSVSAFAGYDNYGYRLVDQSQYTCQQLRTLLTKERSLWFRNRMLPFVQFNIAADRNAPLRCNGAYSGTNIECRYYRGQVTAMDGVCQMGVACACENIRRRDDRDHGNRRDRDHGGFRGGNRQHGHGGGDHQGGGHRRGGDSRPGGHRG